MARTNYQQGKRLRELAKKQKKEEKEKKKAERKTGAPEDAPPGDETVTATVTPAEGEH
jgi:hypothetical protein